MIIGSRHFLEDDENISFKDHQNKIEELLINGDNPLYIGDVMLRRDDIKAVADARELAISCLSKVNNSFKVTVGVNSLILATLGKLSPIQTAIAHNGTTIALLLNALRRIKIKDK